MAKPTPSPKSITAELGPARRTWDAIVAALDETHGPIVQEWKVSKSDFGWICLFKQKKRTLLYMTPGKKAIHIAIVLGERAVALALESDLPTRIKDLLREARPYAEGRGIRFLARSAADVATVAELVTLKTTPT